MAVTMATWKYQILKDLRAANLSALDSQVTTNKADQTFTVVPPRGVTGAAATKWLRMAYDTLHHPGVTCSKGPGNQITIGMPGSGNASSASRSKKY
jgi:hypothetical protein